MPGYFRGLVERLSDPQAALEEKRKMREYLISTIVNQVKLGSINPDTANQKISQIQSGDMNLPTSQTGAGGATEPIQYKPEYSLEHPQKLTPGLKYTYNEKGQFIPVPEGINVTKQEVMATPRPVETPEQKATTAGMVETAREEAKRKFKITLSTKALSVASEYFVRTGQMPLGFGNPDMRAQIFQDIADKGIDAGQIAENVASFTAGKAELVGIQKMRGAVESFADTARAGAELALESSNKIYRVDPQLLNKILLSTERQVFADKDAQQLHIYVTTFKNEFARIMNSATGGGVSTDQAKAEADELFKDVQSPDQMVSAIEAGLKDLDNRTRSFEKGVRRVRGEIRRGSAPSKEQKEKINKTSSDILNKYGIK